MPQWLRASAQIESSELHSDSDYRKNCGENSEGANEANEEADKTRETMIWGRKATIIEPCSFGQEHHM